MKRHPPHQGGKVNIHWEKCLGKNGPNARLLPPGLYPIPQRGGKKAIERTEPGGGVTTITWVGHGKRGYWLGGKVGKIQYPQQSTGQNKGTGKQRSTPHTGQRQVCVGRKLQVCVVGRSQCRQGAGRVEITRVKGKRGWGVGLGEGKQRPTKMQMNHTTAEPSPNHHTPPLSWECNAGMAGIDTKSPTKQTNQCLGGWWGKGVGTGGRRVGAAGRNAAIEPVCSKITPRHGMAGNKGQMVGYGGG